MRLLVVPLYHRVDHEIERHFAFFKEFSMKFPGESLERGINVCITFDDATDDFYQIAFPLIKSYDLKTLLAVPVQFVGKESYCSWKELREICKSKQVKIASHSMSHPNMTETIDLNWEVKESKRALQEKLETNVDTFVYPYGKFNEQIHKRVKEEYPFAMRIGMAYNYGWNSDLIYRISADFKESPKKLFRMKYHFAHWMNSLRGR